MSPSFTDDIRIKKTLSPRKLIKQTALETSITLLDFQQEYSKCNNSDDRKNKNEWCKAVKDRNQKSSQKLLHHLEIHDKGIQMR